MVFLPPFLENIILKLYNFFKKFDEAYLNYLIIYIIALFKLAVNKKYQIIFLRL